MNSPTRPSSAAPRSSAGWKLPLAAVLVVVNVALVVANLSKFDPVSYTHLTLPTIYSV